MIVLQGTGVSVGIANGPLRFFHRVPQVLARDAEHPDAELKRYEHAVQVALDELDALCQKARVEAGEEAASLFEAHQMMLEDLDFVDAIHNLIENEHLSAEAAVQDAGEQFSAMFAAMDDSYMQARASDVKDISSRLIRILSGAEGCGISGTEPVIVAADDLTPSETVQLDKSRILGFILAAGNSNSHTAILARTLGIPAVIGAGTDLKPELENRYVVLDGQAGQLFVDPDTATASYLAEKQQQERALRRMLQELKGQPDVTLDGKEIKLYANISNPSDIDAVINNDARGIGLFRSEFLYLENSDYPTEDQQFEAYKTVLQRMSGQRVIIRTLDIGADKQVGYFKLPHEENTALGMRAIRICLTRPEIFKTQLRALYRASAYGKLAIMFPMITSLWEVQEVKRICAIVRKELAREQIHFDENVELGIMIETPAAAMISDVLAKEVDFFSLGTNDLTQYTLAVDRQGVKGLERFYDAHHPAMLRLIWLTVRNAHRAGIWAGICGELASDLSLLEVFLAMGVDELSVSPRAVLPLRQAIRSQEAGKNRGQLLTGLNMDF